MIARLDGQIVLVSGAIPGERITAVVERIGKGVAYADTVSVEQASPNRREVTADPLCGGCLYAHVAYDHQREIKAAVVADAFTRIAHLDTPTPIPVAASPEDGYRMRARLHVRAGRVGFFREGTHEICDARQTRQLLPATCDALDRIAAELRAWDRDAVREIELAENIDASERVVELDSIRPLDRSTLERIAATDGVTGLVSGRDGYGSAHVIDRLTLESRHSVTLRRHVRSFFQGNRFLIADFVAYVVRQVPEGSVVIDLYAGVGLFSVSAALVRGARVTAIEGDRVAAADLRDNAARSNGAVTALHDSVESFLGAPRRAPTRPEVMIVDPPRTGMSRAALAGAVRVGSTRIVYASCDVATLARDARRLADAGYTLTQLAAFDLFPNTPHVETVATFDRTPLH
jgi:23S rRNA (uracil1939-C5)-methyltransferase